MKTQLNRFADRRAFRLGVSITTTLLLLAVLPATAQTNTPFTSTGWLAAVPVPGILCTNALGQTFLKGNVHVLRGQADDARMTGRVQAGMDVAYQTDGTAIFSGTAYNEVGTWQNQTNFTATGGLWEMSYRGVMQADGSDQFNVTGYGIGGTIDGQRVQCTATKAAGTPFDPAIPYLFSGIIKPAPLDTTVVINNFDGPTLPSWSTGSGSGTMNLILTNGQLTIRGNWPGIHTVDPSDTAAYAYPMQNWAVNQGQSLEARLDLVSLNGAAPGAVVALYHDSGLAYFMSKSRDSVCVGKQNSGWTYLSADKLTTMNTNEVLVLALTPSGQNVILMARVLDKSNGGAVLYERIIVDTPASDPSLNSAQLAAITGMTLSVRSDPSGAPWTSGTAPFLAVFQYTDGTLSYAEATFDNFELRTYEIPPLGIQRAMRLTWPAPAGVNWAVESAPTVQGPWLPVQDPGLPGVQQMTVPANDIMGFFRLRQAP
jgi:hypothetical protein